MPVIADRSSMNAADISRSCRLRTGAGKRAGSVIWTFMRSLTVLNIRPSAVARSKVGYDEATSSANGWSRKGSMRTNRNGDAMANWC